MYGTGTCGNQENTPFVLLNHAIGATGDQISDGVRDEPFDNIRFSREWQNLAKQGVGGVARPHSRQEILRHENRKSSQEVCIVVGNSQSGKRGLQRLLRLYEPKSEQEIFG